MCSITVAAPGAAPESSNVGFSVASIDLGSNTVRLLVAGTGPNGPSRRLLVQEATRLGEGLKPGAPLLPAAVDRTWAVLQRFHKHIASHGVRRTLTGATMAVREAANGPEFLERIRRELGFETLVLTGTQEAQLTAAGVLTCLKPAPEKAVIFDLGGRSTEFILAGQDLNGPSASLELGSVALTETFLTSDTPTSDQIRACRAEVSDRLIRGLGDLAAAADETGGDIALVGTAGTTTTLAAMAQGMTEYRPELINNFALERTVLADMIKDMSALTSSERSRIPGLPKDRADIIVAGAVVVLEILDFFEKKHFIVSDAGLLEGLWLAAAGLRSIET